MPRMIPRLWKCTLGVTMGAALLSAPLMMAHAGKTTRTKSANAHLVKTKPMTHTTKTASKQTPLFRDFMGINGHVPNFNVGLYSPVVRLWRDYHPVDWDLDKDTSKLPSFPSSKNGFNWDTEYSPWVRAGGDIDACLQIEFIPNGTWKDITKDPYWYGWAFARSFGPSGTGKTVNSIEIGNEPGKVSAADYHTIFASLAKGIRQGDPKMKIATCNVVFGKKDDYSQPISVLDGLTNMYDILNIHTYAFAEQYPTWRRSFPEDPTIEFLKPIKEGVAWRNAHAPGKEIWVTEFGWDATTKPDKPTGDFSKWQGSTELQQAQYLVRAFLTFSGMDVDRAYIYYYDDQDDPQLHGSSGITRNSVPKPSYWAVRHLYRTLGGYRFARKVKEQPGALYAYEYQSGTGKKSRIWAVWSPTGSNRTADVTLPAPGGTVVKAEAMPLKDGAADAAPYTVQPDGQIKLTVGESPVYLWIAGK